MSNKVMTVNGAVLITSNKAVIYDDSGGSTPNLQTKSNINPTTSSQTITYDSGYDGLNSVQINAMPTGTAGTPTATKGTMSNNSISVTPSVTNVTGYISGGTKTGTAVIVSASELVSGTKSITSNGTNIDVTNYAAVDVSVSGGTVNIEDSKSYTVSASGTTTISPSSSYDAMAEVALTVPAQSLPTSAVASATSGYTSKATISRSTSDQYINIPTGFNNSGAYYKINAVANGSATPASSISGSSASVSTGTNTLTLSKTISNTPQVSAGYISSGTAGNTSVSLTASITTKGATTYTPTTTDQTIASGTYLTGVQTISGDADLVAGNIKKNVTIFGVTGSYEGGSSVNVETSKSYTVSSSGSSTISPSNGYDAMAEVALTVPAGTEGTPTATKGTVSNHAVSVTPSVTNVGGYISGSTKNGTAVSVSASELVSGTYSVTSSGTKDVTNYASASVPSLTLPTSVSASATSGYTSKATISRSTSDQYINIGTGFNDAGAYYKISAVANGSATPAATISGSSATVSTGTNTLTLSKTVSNTPQVSAGYVSSGTAGNTSVSLTASVTTKAAATITPTTTNQTIASGTYLTGTQTIAGDADLVAGNIKSGVTIFGVTGNYEGSGGNIQTNRNITLGGGTSTINPSSGYDAMAKVTAFVPDFDFNISNPPEEPHGLEVTISGSSVTVAALSDGYVYGYEGITFNVPSGGLALIYTYSLGTLSTSSTSAASTNKSLSLASTTGWSDYDVLVIDVSVNTTTNGRHTSTVSMVYLTGTSDVNTKNTYTVGGNKWNSKLSSSGTASTRQSTSSYGIYANSASVSSSTLSIPLYYRYNSNNTGTINGTYTARVYGLKLINLIGG